MISGNSADVCVPKTAGIGDFFQPCGRPIVFIGFSGICHITRHDNARCWPSLVCQLLNVLDEFITDKVMHNQRAIFFLAEVNIGEMQKAKHHQRHILWKVNKLN